METYINIVIEQTPFLFYEHLNTYNVKKVTLSYVLTFNKYSAKFMTIF